MNTTLNNCHLGHKESTVRTLLSKQDDVGQDTITLCRVFTSTLRGAHFMQKGWQERIFYCSESSKRIGFRSSQQYFLRLQYVVWMILQDDILLKRINPCHVIEGRQTSNGRVSEMESHRTITWARSFYFFSENDTITLYVGYTFYPCHNPNSDPKAK